MELYALVIDADAKERRAVRDTLCNQGWKVSEAASVEEVLRLTESYSWKLIYCDAHLSTKRVDNSGDVTLLKRLQERCGAGVHIVVTVTPGNAGSAVEAILNGAADCINKPCSQAQIYEHSNLVRERMQAAKQESRDLSNHRSPGCNPALSDYELIGNSEAVLRVFKEVAKSVRTDYTADGSTARGKHFLITGETGTGKELVARLIHRHSRYRTGAFIPVNCSNLPAELADTELFGSSPGAFTGADKHEHLGLWEMASGGTLFLDEITEAPRAVMPKLLRVLQDGQVRHLGSKRWIKTDVQVIAATNRDVTTEIRRGRFREDVYHRLSQNHIYLSPLRERIEDIPLLATHFTNVHSGGSMRIASDALKSLVDYSGDYEWRGNVRELENVIRRAVTHTTSKVLYAVDLSPHLPSKSTTIAEKVGHSTDQDRRTVCACKDGGQNGLDERVRRFRNTLIKETLAAHNGNRSRAAESLYISRAKFHRLLNKMDQERELR